MSENLTKKCVMELGDFKVGDFVDSFGCEEGRPYMPGTGVILTIRPDEERPFVCEHGNKVYYYKESEIEHTDLA